MLMPNDLLLSSTVLCGLSLRHRNRPYLSPYLRCTFATLPHHFACDTFVTDAGLLDGRVPEVKQLCQPWGSEYNQMTSKKSVHCPEAIGQKSQAKLKNGNGVQGTCLAYLAILEARVKWFSLWMFTPTCLLTYLAFLAYWPTLSAELVFDDRPAIIDNKDLRPDESWFRLWLNDFWGMSLQSKLSHKSYRPLTVLTFRLNYLVHQTEPFGYHLVNVALHALVTLLFYRFTQKFFQTYTTISSSNPATDSSHSTVCLCQSTSFLMSMIFAVHPIHTDCVSSVVGRAELLSAICYLGAILCWDRKCNEMKEQRPVRRQNITTSLTRSRQRFRLLAILLAYVGFLCKEQCIFVLLYLALYEIVREKRKSVASASLRRLSRLPPLRGVSLNLTWPILLLVTFLLATCVRFALIGYSLPTFNRLDNPAAYAPFPIKQLTHAYIVLYHFWLLLLPDHLSCDWTHGSIDLIDFTPNLFHLHLARTLLTLITWFVLALALLYLLWLVLIARHQISASTTHLAQQALLALALTAVPFVPASNLLFPTGFVIAERVLYLPSIGFLCLLGIGLKILVKCNLPLKYASKRKHQFTQQKFLSIHMVYFMVLLLTATFTFKTHLRSRDWATELQLYESGLSVNPRNTKLINNLGRLHEKNGQLEKAIKLYKKAISIGPKDIRSYLNLGNALLSKGEKAKAEMTYRQALDQIEENVFVEFSPKRMIPTKDRGKTLNWWDEDERRYISPLYLTTLVRLAEVIEGEPEKQDESRHIQQKMIALQSMMIGSSHTEETWLLSRSKDIRLKAPSWSHGCHFANSNFKHLEANQLYNVAVMHYQQGRQVEALHCFEHVLKLEPHHVSALLASARIIQDQEINHLYIVAIDRLNKLVQIGKGDASVYFHLAMMSIKLKRFAEARQFLNQAIKQRDLFVEAHYNLALLLTKEINSVENNVDKKADNLREAIFHLKRVLTINPTHIKSMLALGDFYAEELEHLDRSQYYYQMVIDRVDPNNVRARHNLCVLWHKKGDLVQSIECFENLQQDLRRQSNEDEIVGLIGEQLQVLQESHRRSVSVCQVIEPVSEKQNESEWSDTRGPTHYRHLLLSNSYPAMCFN